MSQHSVRVEIFDQHRHLVDRHTFKRTAGEEGDDFATVTIGGLEYTIGVHVGEAADEVGG